MKKILFILMLLASFSEAKAQWFVGGNAGLTISSEVFSGALEPIGGYEFNDRWAVGGGIGFQANSNDAAAFWVEPFVRYTPWHNDLICLDIKGITQFEFDSNYEYLLCGFVPSLRIHLNDRWDLSADFGALAVLFGDYEPTPYISARNLNTCATLTYRFKGKK